MTKTANQLTLGELTDKIATLPPECGVYFDFGYLRPSSLDSYRGYYEDLAIGYEAGGHIKAAEFLGMLRAANGASFTGWKGGEYRVSRETALWAGNRGEYSGHAIVGVRVWCGHTGSPSAAYLIVERDDADDLSEL